MPDLPIQAAVLRISPSFDLLALTWKRPRLPSSTYIALTPARLAFGQMARTRRSHPARPSLSQPPQLFWARLLLARLLLARSRLGSALAMALGLLLTSVADAHGIGGKDAAFVAGAAGTAVGPFMYLGAKHMVTGYDHLLFIFATIFLLYRARQVALYVTLFSLGHSITLLFGTLSRVHVDAYLIDAVIGLSVVYKAFDNLGGFQAWFGRAPNTKLAIFVFGLFHGFGLATKLQELHPSRVGLVQNILSFNLGVELGQLLALFVMFGVILWWRRQAHFQRLTLVANTIIMTCGFMLMGYQLTQYFRIAS